MSTGSTPLPATVPGQPAPDPLADLPPLAMPEAISWWPPAPGWWLLAALLLASCGWLALLGWRSFQHGRARRECLDRLRQIGDNYRAHGSTQRYLTDVNQLIKRFALHYYPEAGLASLHGQPLLEQLDAISGQPLLNNHTGMQLLGAYRAQPDADVDALQALLTGWFAKAPLRDTRAVAGRPAPGAAR